MCGIQAYLSHTVSREAVAVTLALLTNSYISAPINHLIEPVLLEVYPDGHSIFSGEPSDELDTAWSELVARKSLAYNSFHSRGELTSLQQCSSNPPGLKSSRETKTQRKD
jgi:hypothetical protein